MTRPKRSPADGAGVYFFGRNGLAVSPALSLVIGTSGTKVKGGPSDRRDIWRRSAPRSCRSHSLLRRDGAGRGLRLRGHGHEVRAAVDAIGSDALAARGVDRLSGADHRNVSAGPDVAVLGKLGQHVGDVRLRRLSSTIQS